MTELFNQHKRIRPAYVDYVISVEISHCQLDGDLHRPSNHIVILIGEFGAISSKEVKAEISISWWVASVFPPRDKHTPTSKLVLQYIFSSAVMVLNDRFAKSKVFLLLDPDRFDYYWTPIPVYYFQRVRECSLDTRFPRVEDGRGWHGLACDKIGLAFCLYNLTLKQGQRNPSCVQCTDGSCPSRQGSKPITVAVRPNAPICTPSPRKNHLLRSEGRQKRQARKSCQYSNHHYYEVSHREKISEPATYRKLPA